MSRSFRFVAFLLDETRHAMMTRRTTRMPLAAGVIMMIVMSRRMNVGSIGGGEVVVCFVWLGLVLLCDEVKLGVDG